MRRGNKNDRGSWRLPEDKCLPLRGKAPRAFRLVQLGAPGVGKGTQAELLSDRLEICHLSTGDLFRSIGKNGDANHSPAMAEAIAYMRRGELIPDSMVWSLVLERGKCIQSPGGFLLDGFPRTLGQAAQLKDYMEQEGLVLDGVVDYEMPLAEIIARLSGRRTCEKCKAVFHIKWLPPETEGICDECGGHLFQREDDRPEAVVTRLEVYRRSTAPLVQFYRDLGLLISVDATGSPEEVFACTMAALEARV